MKYARQTAVATLLDERLPRAYGRGPRALSQNICRSVVNAFILSGVTLEQAVRAATLQVQQSDLAFVPDVRRSKEPQ